MKKLSAPLHYALGLLALALMLNVSSAQTEEAPPPKEKGPSKSELKKYDANGDGQLDEMEKAKMKADDKARRDAQRAEDLANYDADKNGKLSKEEKAKKKADHEAAREARKAEKEAEKAAKDAAKK
jgi:hypothetical protein